jgi:hypothetical protein
MGRCVFNSHEVARCIQHALNAENWRASYTQENLGPSIFFVKDRGIYIMSNGLPADNNNTENDQTFVAYDEDCYPDNPNCWELSREKVGGDDFVEAIEATEDFLAACHQFDKVVVNVFPTEFNICFEHDEASNTHDAQNEISNTPG